MQEIGKKLVKANDKSYTLSDSQREAKTKFKEWFSSKNLIFTLSGSAGTGKTWLINDLINTIIKPKGKRALVSAPTHKAVRVIEKFTKLKGMTIHSLHGLRPNFNLNDFNINNITFQSIGTDKFKSYDIIFIDEASMIGADLHKLNVLRAMQHTTKICYIGDKLQLLPIKENKISEAFSSKYGYNLLNIIRQDIDNPLLDLLVQLRTDILNNTSMFLNFISKSNNKYNIIDKHGYKVTNLKSFVHNIKFAFESELFNKNVNSYRIAAYTNASVNFWNRIVRKHLINSTDLLVKGDKLMGYKTIVNEYLQPIIINSNDYEVLDVSSKITDDNFKVFMVTIKDYESGFIYNIYIVDHTDKTFINYYRKLCVLHRNALYASPIEKGKLWKEYYHYKDVFMTMIDFNLVYDNRKQGSVKREIDYAYATTVHKLQGSTIDNIFLDAMDISYYNSNPHTPRVNTPNRNDVINTRNRLLYTGLSRTRNIGNILFYR